MTDTTMEYRTASRSVAAAAGGVLVLGAIPVVVIVGRLLRGRARFGSELPLLLLWCLFTAGLVGLLLQCANRIQRGRRWAAVVAMLVLAGFTASLHPPFGPPYQLGETYRMSLAFLFALAVVPVAEAFVCMIRAAGTGHGLAVVPIGIGAAQAFEAEAAPRGDDVRIAVPVLPMDAAVLPPETAPPRTRTAASAIALGVFLLARLYASTNLNLARMVRYLTFSPGAGALRLLDLLAGVALILAGIAYGGGERWARALVLSGVIAVLLGPAYTLLTQFMYVFVYGSSLYGLHAFLRLWLLCMQAIPVGAASYIAYQVLRLDDDAVMA